MNIVYAKKVQVQVKRRTFYKCLGIWGWPKHKNYLNKNKVIFTTHTFVSAIHRPVNLTLTITIVFYK